MPTKPRYIIGIDAGTNTGLAVWSTEKKKLIELKTIPIHQAMDAVRTWSHLGAFVRVEDARKRNYFGKSGSEMWQGAGSIKRDCTIWEDFLIDNHIEFELVAPKNNKTKMKASFFAKLTGWKKICSVHARDAAMLVYGM